MLPRRHRLTRPGEFSAVLRGGTRSGARRAGGRMVVVHRRDGGPDHAPDDEPTPTRPPRVGFVVSKAVGNSVVRHRVTRRLRALMAPRLAGLPDGADVVVRAQPAAATARFDEIAADLDRALERVAR